MSLSTPLLQGDLVIALDPNSQDETQIAEVEAAAPEVWSVADAFGPMAGGETITISGYGLPASPTVTFGTTTATVVSSSATEIEVVVPVSSATESEQVEVEITGSASTVAFTYFYFVPLAE